MKSSTILTPDLQKLLTLLNLCCKNESKADNYLVKVKNGSSRKRREIYLKLRTTTRKQYNFGVPTVQSTCKKV